MIRKEAKELLLDLVVCLLNGDTPSSQDVKKYISAISMAIAVMFTED